MKQIRRISLWLFLLLASLTVVRFSAADTIRQTEVGSEEERLRRPRELEVPERAEIPIELPPEGELSPIAAGAPPIAVSHIEVDGATLLPDRVARALVSGVEGREVPLQDLRRVALAVTRWYRGRGYVTSRALVPAQGVEKGVVHLRVVEGKVGQVRIEGNKYFPTELLAGYVRVHPGEILYMPRIEAALVQINSSPDRKAKLVLVPASQPETTDLVFQVTDKYPFHANYAVDTLGTKETGEIRQSVLLSHGNVTGHDDQALIKGVITEFGGLKGGAFSYYRPLNPSGLAGTFDASGVTSSVGGDLENLRARGNAITLSPGLVVPLVRRSGWELEATTGFDWKRVRTRLDAVSDSKDDLRVVRVGTGYLEQDKRGRSLLIQELRVGIPNVLGASHSEDVAASRAGAGGSFVRWVTNLVRVQKGPAGTSLVFRGSSQLTSDRLVPAEQFRLGGFDTVRGYPEGEFLADYGYQATVEARLPSDRILPAFGAAGEKSAWNRLRRSLLLVGFWDFAEGFLRAPRLGEDADMRLESVGCGFRLRPTAESSLQADFGWPVGDRDAEKDRPRLHLICRIGF